MTDEAKPGAQETTGATGTETAAAAETKETQGQGTAPGEAGAGDGAKDQAPSGAGEEGVRKTEGSESEGETEKSWIKDDSKPEGEEKGEGEGEGGEKAEYGEFTLPESMEMDTEMLSEFVPIARELKLNQEQAQKLVTLYAEKVSRMAAEQQKSALAWFNADFDAAMADAEYGGTKFEASMQVVESGLKAIDPDGRFKAHLHRVGFVSKNDPELLRILYRIGMASREDRTPAGTAAVSGKSTEEIMYPTMHNK